jgi:hypothetical protein
MNITAPWNDRLAEPLSKEHLVQLYRDDAVLVEAVALYAGRGLGKGEAVILVATEPHRKAIEARLQSIGFEVDDLKGWGQLRVLDAGRLLSRFLVDGRIDSTLFQSILGELVATTRAGGRFRKVRVYGEMVNLLWKHNHPATHRLEELWNEAIQAHSVSLLCGYQLQGIDEGDEHFPLDLRALHSHLIPLEAGA